MKNLRVFIPCLIILGTFFCWIGLPDSDSASLWPSKSDILSWYSPTTGATVELAITRTIANHYLVHGLITEQSGEMQPVDGNAVIVDGEVLMHINTSGFGANSAWGASSNVVLDLNTLDGVANGVFIEAFPPPPPNNTTVRYDGPIDLTYVP